MLNSKYAKSTIQVFQQCEIALRHFMLTKAPNGTKCIPNDLDYIRAANAIAAIYEYHELRGINYTLEASNES